ncbi:hypothetical protein THERMOT_225 [Bathymodiolus thermophilus thioautotrophic gill symbiont]|nr:hypothetical protein THERMOT_225 [Bathymodiolus thermophilus thioautotrophic gill symbiont]
MLGQGLRKLPSGQKLNFANHPYLCKGLHIAFQQCQKIVRIKQKKIGVRKRI